MVANAKHVADARGKRALERIFDVHNLEPPVVLFTMRNDPNSAHVASARDVGQVANLKLDNVCDLARREIQLDRVVDFDEGVGVAQRAAVVGHEKGDLVLAYFHLLDLAQLEIGLVLVDAVHGKAALDVVQQAKVLARLLDTDDVHEAGGVGLVGSDLAVHFDEALHDYGLGLLAGQGVAQAVAQKDDEGDALALLVRATRRLGGPGARELVEHPVLGGVQPFQVFLGAAGHEEKRAGL